jgi:peptidoglycan/LPS O-acetylase OafA/YrhL
METKSKAHYFDQIQVLRGVAAIMVVFHHSIGSLKYYHQISNPFLDLIGFVGRFGVDFFFVLSGFIITISANGKYGTSNSLKNYIINRVIRIYIPYLPIGIVMFLLCHFLSQYSNGN